MPTGADRYRPVMSTSVDTSARLAWSIAELDNSVGTNGMRALDGQLRVLSLCGLRTCLTVCHREMLDLILG